MRLLRRRGLCDGPFTRPEDSHRVWSVVCLNVTEEPRRGPNPTGGSQAVRKKKVHLMFQCYQLTDLCHYSYMVHGLGPK